MRHPRGDILRHISSVHTCESLGLETAMEVVFRGYMELPLVFRARAAIDRNIENVVISHGAFPLTSFYLKRSCAEGPRNTQTCRSTSCQHLPRRVSANLPKRYCRMGEQQAQRGYTFGKSELVSLASKLGSNLIARISRSVVSRL